MALPRRRVLLGVLATVTSARAVFVGVGKADGTGPTTSYTFMGMAKPDQKGEGLWTRLFARAFIVANDDDERVAFVSLDAGMVGYVLKKKALELLDDDVRKYLDETNVMISGTHTHSGPSGFLQHMIFQLAGSGWVPQVGEAMATGIANAITKAHRDLEGQIAAASKRTLAVARTSLANASINRSPNAYLANPQAERDVYNSNVDLDFVCLVVAEDDETAAALSPKEQDEQDAPPSEQQQLGGGLVSSSAKHVAALVTWFAVHPTSMNNTNKLVASDNKGLASLLTERSTGIPVVAMASSNLGDVSPNTRGPHCLDTGEECDFATSTCPESVLRFSVQRNEQCVALGPGVDMFESTQIIAERQSALATAMVADFLDTESFPSAYQWRDLGGAVTSAHSFVRMPGLQVRDWQTNRTLLGTLCKPALGQSFAAGTIDGPGAFSFAQNKTSKNPLWPILAEALATFGHDEESYDDFSECHAPKDVFIPTGAMDEPHPWAPSVLPFQLFKIGALVIAGVPTEMTTMAGRRLKNMLVSIFNDDAGEQIVPVIAGLSNEYSDYTTTFEEYQVQRYEGGSTIYGPYQLDAYLQEYARLARQLIAGGSREPSSDDAVPEDFSAELDLWPWLKYESRNDLEEPPKDANFGDVLAASATSVAPGGVYSVDFVGGDLKHDLKLDSTYFEVQLEAAGGWTTVLTDEDPETRITCLPEDAYKRVTVRVDPVPDVFGRYRVLYHGNARVRSRLSTDIISFDGVSPTFAVASLF